MIEEFSNRTVSARNSRINASVYNVFSPRMKSGGHCDGGEAAGQGIPLRVGSGGAGSLWPWTSLSLPAPDRGDRP